MSVLIGWLFILFVKTSGIANAKPVALPVTKIGEQDLVTVLTNEKYLLLLLLANGLYITIGLIRSIWDSKKKQLDEIQKLTAMIPTLISKIEHMDSHMKHLPTHDQVELKLWRALKDKEQ